MIEVIDYAAQLLKRAEVYCNEKGGSIRSRQIEALARVMAEELYELKGHKHRNLDYEKLWTTLYSDLTELDRADTEVIGTEMSFTVKQILESMRTLEKRLGK